MKQHYCNVAASAIFHYSLVKKEGYIMDLMALALEKKKKQIENNKSFQKAGKATANNANHKMPMRKAGRGK